MKILFLIFFLINFEAHATFPTLVVTTFDGKKFDLAAKKNKIIIVNFWAKWCVQCREEMPILDEVYKKYKSRGLEVIALSIDRPKYRDAVKKIAAQFSYPNALFSDAEKNSFDEPNSIPRSYIIKGGEVVKVLDNVYKEDFENALDPLF